MLPDCSTELNVLFMFRPLVVMNASWLKANLQLGSTKRRFDSSSQYFVLSESTASNLCVSTQMQLGIAAPTWFADVMIDVIGVKETSRMLQLGSLHPAEHALKIGTLVKHSRVHHVVWIGYELRDLSKC